MNTQDCLTVEEFIKYLKEQKNITVTRRTLRYYALNRIFPPPAKKHGNRGYHSISQIPQLETILLLKS
ncbi:hypothetical protein ACFL0P_07375 [Candidatus Omnitrophota bacterium]